MNVSTALATSDGGFVAEASEIGLRPGVQIPQTMVLFEGHMRIGAFHFVGTDRSGDDIAGWRYREQSGDRIFLLIND